MDALEYQVYFPGAEQYYFDCSLWDIMFKTRNKYGISAHHP